MRKNRNNRKEKKVYLIFIEGKTEKWYLQLLKKYENIPRIDIKPELHKKSKLNDKVNSIKDNSKIYNKVFWILDFDSFIKEDKERRTGRRSIIDKFKDYAKELKELKNVEILINNPCFEFWILLHYKDTDKFYSKCKNVEKYIKKNYLQNYEKSEKYYKKKNNDIYKRLKPNQKTAISNAKELKSFEFTNIESAKAEIFKLIEFLKIN